MTIDVETFVDSYDFTDPEFRNLPPEFIWEVYRRLRSRGPVAFGENKCENGPGSALFRRQGGEWQVLRYKDVYEVVQDPQRFSSVYDEGSEEFPDPQIGSILRLDPPEQNRDKKSITPFFSPARMRTLEARVREVVDEEIDSFIECGTGDLSNIAWRVPGVILFEELLGFPVEDVQTVLRMTDRMMHPASYGLTNRAVAAKEMYTYCYERLSARQGRSSTQDNDVFDHLLGVRVDRQPLPFDRVLANAYLFVIAGLETTSNAMTNAFVWLGEHPDERRCLIEDPELIPKALEELLRYGGSVHGMPRIATQDTEIAGCPIQKGDLVVVNYAAANRDPEEFDRPDECVLDRDPNRHLTFGAGYHRCVGSNLARMEMRVSIEQVLKRLPDYRISDAPPAVYRHGIIPGYSSVPVIFSSGERS